MSISRTVIALSLDHDRVYALSAATGGGSVVAKSWFSTQVPSGVDLKDAAAVGEWLGKALDEAKLPRGRLVIAVPRGEVVLKRLKLPRGAGAGETELAGMVRLQMARQLTVGMEGTAIDYVPIGTDHDEGEPAAPGSVSVLAGALPSDRMAWYQALAKAAGCKIDRLGLRAAGLSALLAAASQRHNGPVLGIAAGLGSIEFVIVEDGQLVFARAADGGTAGAEEGFAQRAAVEAKRTWMSYRVGDGSTEVDGIALPGEGKLAQELGQRCGEALEMAFELVGIPDRIELPREMSETDRMAAAPLIGLLAEGILAKPSLDFANPRKAPDLAAAKRQRAMLAVLAVIVLGGGAYFLAIQRLGHAEADLKKAESHGASLAEQYQQYLKEDARLRHIKQWTSARTDWLAHTKWLSDQMPDPRQALMDEVTGNLKATVEFVTKDGRYDPSGWQTRQVAAIGIQGQIKEREVANNLRERLVSSGLFLQVESKGADVADHFEFVLTTSKAAPDTVKPAAARADRGSNQ